jgi:hypothetical protein
MEEWQERQGQELEVEISTCNAVSRSAGRCRTTPLSHRADSPSCPHPLTPSTPALLGQMVRLAVISESDRRNEPPPFPVQPPPPPFPAHTVVLAGASVMPCPADSVLCLLARPPFFSSSPPLSLLRMRAPSFRPSLPSASSSTRTFPVALPPVHIALLPLPVLPVTESCLCGLFPPPAFP